MNGTRAEGRTEAMNEPCSYPGCKLLYLHPGAHVLALSPEVAELVAAAEAVLFYGGHEPEVEAQLRDAVAKVRGRS